MPKELSHKLAHINLTQSAHQPSSGELYSYRILVCGGHTYHVLSCQLAELFVHRIHHLVITQEEVLHLQKNAARPTPAGIILALQKLGFWNQAAGSGIAPDAEPRLTAAALPDASLQPTWKALTKHKNNARIFLLPPYERECVVEVPGQFSPMDILHLFHESDWISSNRGWGTTFTTDGGEFDNTAEFARIVVQPNSPLMERAQAIGLPCLRITEDMQLPEVPEIPRAPRFTPQHRPPKSPMAYKYAETPDADVFNILPRPNKWVRWSCYLGGVALLWCSVSLISGFFMEDAGQVTGTIISHINTRENVQLLADLANSAYSPEVTARKLATLESHLSSQPNTQEKAEKQTNLLECLQLLRSAAIDTDGHPDKIRRLISHATELNINKVSLSLLYINEALNKRTADEWLASMPQEERSAWLALLHEEPELAQKLAEPAYSPFFAAFCPQETPAR